ncbi:uncharacterized protein DUF3108 [Sinobacterium caligoides]|uniref:Uncharacterized protein DUF3108 n=1 Tax=Sinobacterium caligoides TaxID=933926 RepID=A0A3N2DPV9_9GAMM|nr:DUF3108 domain-containing protein [Sinobacterium caligoides]ROS01823.1 uncharacterized protein DUF3108 [Sinobacterium caligoides]
MDQSPIRAIFCTLVIAHLKQQTANEALILPSRLRHILSLCYSALALSLPLQAHADEAARTLDIVEYSASYQTHAMGLDITAKRQLKQLDNNQYQLLNNSEVMFYSITEESRFQLNSDGQLKTNSYQQQRKGLGSNKSIEQQWNWSAQSVISRYKGRDYRYAITPQSLDKLNYQLALRRDAQRLGDNFGQQRYTIADRKRLRDDFLIDYLGEEVITTPLGRFNAVKFERRKDDDENNIIWLAKDWHYMILKISHCEQKQCEDILLSEAVVDGQQMTGLTAAKH